MSLKYTPVSAIPGIVAGARAAFDAGKTRPVEWRVAQLKQLRRLMTENKDAIVAAIRADLGRPELECVVAEILVCVAEIDHTLKHLKEWLQPTPVGTPALLLPGHSYTQPDPLGVALIIGPWNFPIQLIVNVLIPALAGGNACVCKPSEIAPASAALMETLLPRYLDADAVRLVQGGVAETSVLLEQRFDHIFYTGAGPVGSVVMAAAAKHLTPVTLELGGKSPCIVDKDADIELTAKRIITNKCLNNGQVCLSPDYVLVHRDVATRLIDAMTATLTAFYGPDPSTSPDLGRMVNARHWARVKRLLDTAGGTIVAGGQTNEASLYIAPTLILSPSQDAPVMAEEIFGPLLPILPVANVDEAISYVAAKPKPLALYVFTSSSATAAKVLKETTSGGAVVNDAVVHNANPDLPFGGVGPSGIGAYHGRYGFDTFTHRKAVFVQPTWIDMGKLRYPPYSKGQLSLLETLINALPAVPRVSWKDVALVGMGAAVAYLAHKVNAMGGEVLPFKLPAAAGGALSSLLGGSK